MLNHAFASVPSTTGLSVDQPAPLCVGYSLKILRQMIHHPLTDAGILQFRKDWETVEKPAPLKKKLDDAPIAVAAS